MGIWQTGDGAPIVDGSGAIIECDDHPCDPCEEEGSCPTNPEIPDFLLCEIEMSDPAAVPGCIGCATYNDSYVIDYGGYNATLALTCRWGNVFIDAGVIDCDGGISDPGDAELRIAMNLYADGTCVLIIETFREAFYKKDGPFLGLPITFTAADKYLSASCVDTLEPRDCILDTITISG
jgi:hypothetical protein